MPSAPVGAVRPPRWKASKIRSRSASAIPMPVSVTDTSTSPSVTRAAISTEPPSGVNLTALVRRFSSTCLSFSSSAQTMPMSPAMSRRTEIPCLAARSRTIASPWSIASASDTGPSSSSIRPASTLERSRISLMSSSR